MYVRKIPNWWSLLPACGKKHVAYVFEIWQVKIVCVLPCESLDPPIDRRGLTLFFAGFFWISKLPVTWDPMIVRVVMALMTNFFSWNKMFMRISGYPHPPAIWPAQKWNKALGLSTSINHPLIRPLKLSIFGSAISLLVFLSALGYFPGILEEKIVVFYR